MDWGKIRSKKREIFVVFTVLLLLFCVSFQGVAAEVIPENEGNEGVGVEPEISALNISLLNESVDGDGADADSGTICLDKVSYKISGSNSWVELASGINGITDLADPAQVIEFQLKFSSTQTLESDFFAGKITLKQGEAARPGCTVSTTNTLGQIKATILANTLEAETSYSLVIDKSIADGVEDKIIEFTTGENTTPEEPTGFAAIFCYPVADSKNAAVDEPIVVAFNQAVKKKTISSDSVTLTKDGTAVATEISLEETTTGTILTIKPEASLSYATDYKLTLAGTITNQDSEALEESSIEFTTKCFTIEDVKVSINSEYTTLEGLEITIKNEGEKNKTANLKVEIRRDLGARLEKGGTVVYLGEFTKNQISTGASNLLTFDKLSIDITQDLYQTAGEEVQGDTYIDIYVLDGNGKQIGDAFHKKI